MGLIDGFKGLIIPTGVSLSASSLSLKVGTTYQLIATISPSGATNQNVTWTSSNPSVATVDATGNITALQQGNCTITVTTQYGEYTDSCSCTLYVIHTTGVYLNESAIDIGEGETFQLEATVEPLDTSYPEVTWSSSNTSIATVSQTGLVTYVSDGECTITVTTADGGFTDTCEVLCNNMPGYTKCEYIESTGAQYIDTGLKLNPNTTFDFKFQLTSTTNEQGIIGARGSTNAYRHSLMTYNGSFHFMLGDGSAWNGSVDTNIHTITMSGGNGNWTINADGTNYTSASSITANTSCPYYIFRNGSQNTSYVRMYYANFYVSGVLVREFIPVIRNSDGAIGLYDKVNDTFYGNQGSGTFIHGPEIVKINQVQEIEYIQSSGTQYIDTGWYPSSNYAKVVAQIEPTLSGQQWEVFYGMTNGSNHYSLHTNKDTLKRYINVGGNGNIMTDIAFSSGTNVNTEFEANNGAYSVKVNNSTYSGTYSGTVAQSTRNMYIFAYNENGSITWKQNMKLYSFKIYSDASTLVRDFMPCYVKTTGCIGLYDKVEGKYYHNSGTGTFTAGPKIGVSLDKNKISLSVVGQTAQLTATTNPEEIADGGFTWSSSDTSIATVTPIPVRLPSTYQEVKYIESSGTGCGINTGITPHDTNYFEIDFKMQPTSLKSSSNYFYGTDSSGARNSFEYTSSNGSYWNVGSSTLIGTISPNLATGTDYIFDCKYSGNNGGTLTVSGTYSKSVNYSGSTGTNPLYFFCAGNSLGAQSAEKLYYMKIYTGSSEGTKTLVRDFVPCYRKSDGVIGLYDLVNDEFYANAGSGTFIAGDIVGASALVTCVTPGECRITCRTNIGGYTETCEILEKVEHIITVNFDSTTEATNAGYVFQAIDYGGLTVSGGSLVVNANHNDSGGLIYKDVSNYDEWTFQTRVYMQGTSWGGDQHISVAGGDFTGNIRGTNGPQHYFNMTTYSGYTGGSGISDGTTGDAVYSGSGGFTGWYVYEIKYDNGTYTLTRYNDTSEVTDESTYTHKKTFTGLGKAAQVGIFLRTGYTYQNYNKADWAKLIYLE